MKKGAGIVVAMKDDLPEVAQITNVNGNSAVLRARLYPCLFVPHYHGYTLHAPSSVCEKLFYMSKLLCPPVLIRKPHAIGRTSSFSLTLYLMIHNAYVYSKCLLLCQCFSSPNY